MKMKKTATGILLGFFISFGLLIVLALWPLPYELQTDPPTPPSPPLSTPMLSEIPVPEIPPEVPEEPKPSDAGTSLPPEKEIEISVEKPGDISIPAEPAEPPKSSISPIKQKPEGKPKKEIGKAKPAAPKTEDKKRIETVKPALAPEVPPPPAISRTELDALQSLLERLRSAYVGEDLSTIKQLLILSSQQESLLKKIFNSYANLQADLEAMKQGGDRVTSAIRILSLKNENGNAVIPGPGWGRQLLTVTPKDNRWNQVALANAVFKNGQKAPMDFIAPVINHTLPAYTAKPGEPAEITAAITDNIKVILATLRFRAQGERNYEATQMIEGANHAFSGRIPGSMIKTGSTSMEYYIEARDAEGNISLEGRPTAPLVIAVVPPASE